jgi:hypothetical protein
MRTPDQFQHDPNVVVTQMQGGPTITKHTDTVAADLARVAERSGSWVKEQVHTGLQDFVSRVLYGEPASKEPGKDHERDHDKGLDR